MTNKQEDTIPSKSERTWAVGNDVIMDIESLFPSDDIEKSRGRVTGVGDFKIGLDWKLKTDESRKNKWSRAIDLTITCEAIDFLTDDYEQNIEHIKKFIRNKLVDFEAEHNVSYLNSPPREKWVITTKDLIET